MRWQRRDCVAFRLWGSTLIRLACCAAILCASYVGASETLLGVGLVSLIESDAADPFVQTPMTDCVDKANTQYIWPGESFECVGLSAEASACVARAIWQGDVTLESCGTGV